MGLKIIPKGLVKISNLYFDIFSPIVLAKQEPILNNELLSPSLSFDDLIFNSVLNSIAIGNGKKKAVTIATAFYFIVGS